MEQTIQLNDVTKTFGKTTAVNNVSFTIEKGKTIAILGPNGAGKSTTIGMMLGLLDPTEGEISLFGKSPKDLAFKDKVGAMLQDVHLVDKLKVHEIIKLFRSYYSSPLSMEELIAATGLKQEDLNKWADKLSGGQKRRVGFALALAGDPDILFFDEPTVGLDISARQHFWERVENLKAKGKTIIFSTHYLQEADDYSDHIILFNKGNIIADGKPDDIKRQIANKNVSFVSGDPNIMAKLETLPIVISCYEKEGRIYAVTEDTDELLSFIIKNNLDAKDFFIQQIRLEEVFEYLTMDQKESVS